MRKVFVNIDVRKGRILDGGAHKERVATTIADHYAGAANNGTAETDFFADPITPDVLESIGDKVEAHYGGKIAAHATATRRLRVYFDGILIFDSGAVTFALGASWAFYVTVMRSGMTTARYMVTLATASTSIAPASVGELTGLDFTLPIILKVTGQAGSAGAATGDIIAKLGYVEYKPRVQ